ncbi:tail needle knob protein [Edwardsiella piscicida]|uniref:tail needle knob protein n=1 Tax=Edwardsiella piscicida TaxID=1263550 RepID=UPI00370D90B4
MSLYPMGVGGRGPVGPSGGGSVRRKSECYFSGLNLVIPTTPTNLINLIKSLPHTGSLSPFFNTTTNKFNVFNNDSTVTFKVNVVGAWAGSSSQRSMTVSFPSTQGNTLVESRDQAVTADILSFPTFFSVDVGGNLALNGSDITIQSNGAAFTASAILIIAEQMVPSS